MSIKPLSLSSDESLFTHTNDELGYSIYVAILDDNFSCSIGGCRFKSYPSDVAAANDAILLARAMANKASVHDLPHGGAKAVINVKNSDIKKEDILKDFALEVNKLKGRYVTAVDVGTCPKDMDFVQQFSPYVCITSEYPHAASMTALGVYSSIKASCEHYLSKSLNSVKVSIQGAGNVGYDLIALLRRHTKDIVFTDVCEEKIARVLHDFPDLTYVEPDEIFEQKVDIFSPCALGSVINSLTLPKLNTKIVCGAANNQLASLSMDSFLAERGITYVPDYLANGGGLIYASNLYRGLDMDKVKSEVENLYNKCLLLMRDASLNGDTLLSHIQSR